MKHTCEHRKQPESQHNLVFDLLTPSNTEHIISSRGWWLLRGISLICSFDFAFKVKDFIFRLLSLAVEGGHRLPARSLPSEVSSTVPLGAASRWVSKGCFLKQDIDCV